MNGWREIHGDLYHYVNYKLYNVFCPSQIWFNGSKFWRISNKLHRINGPAEEFIDGNNYWWYYGCQVFVKSQQEFERFLRLKSLW